MEGRRRRESGWVQPAVVVAVAVLLGLVAGRAFGVEPPPGKMDRQIQVMEKILDQVLIDSPNFLVSGRGNARGLYVRDFGVILTFSASLVDKDRGWKFDFGEGFKIQTDKDGRKIIILDEEKIAKEKQKAAEEAEKHEDREDTERMSRQEGLYKRGKAELVDALLDYGDTLSTLDKGKWVAIVAYLQDARYFDERGMSKLLLKAKIDDLRLYAADKLSEENMVKRIVEQEY